VRPIFFDGCFGWLHPGAAKHGVVLCGPLGEEADCARRSLRELAEQLAAVGLPTLRFDYVGTGDSEGDELDPGRLRAWLQSTHCAVRWLREEARVDTLTLVGLRFGAALAVACAEQLGSVDRLALLAPVISGRAYRRELVMEARLAQRSVADRSADGLDADGIHLSAETLADLGAFEVLRGPHSPAKHVLILTREGARADAPLAERFTALGADVEEGEFIGYGLLRWNPEAGLHPSAAFRRVVQWIAPNAPAFAGAAPCAGEVEITDAHIRETAVVFGPEPGLFGVSCEPPEPQAQMKPTLLFLNTGTTTHVGPNRLWVSLARRFARGGYRSLRFDLPGIGDSPTQPDQPKPMKDHRQAIADMRSALDWLEGHGSHEVILIGYCLGAPLACNLAMSDPRVVGQILINPWQLFWHETPAPYRVRTPASYVKLVCDPSTWRKTMRGAIPWAQVALGAGRFALGVLGGLKRRFSAAESSSEAAVRVLRSLAARGVDTLLIYGEHEPLLEELEDYFQTRRGSLAELLDLRIQRAPNVGHVFSRRSDRDQLAEIIAEHLEQVSI